jgi:hypothetical protein
LSLPVYRKKTGETEISEPTEWPHPLFFKIAKGATTIFVNAAHVVKIEIEAVDLNSGVLYMDDGTRAELGSNEVDWIMRLMSFHFHEQMKIVSEMKRCSGER